MRKIRELSIKEEQEIQLAILKIFDRMCRKENIPYFLAYGTLLGAVREKGFIEWDDDVDIWVKRDVFDKIVSVFSKYFDLNKYFLQDANSDPMNFSPEMLRICVNGTYKWPDGCENEKFHTGIYFDIFPLDYGFGDERDTRYLFEMTKYHNLLRNHLSFNKHQNRIVRDIYYFMKRIFYPFMKCKEKILSIIKIYSQNPQNKVLVTLPSSFAGSERSIFISEFFEEIEFLEFEDMLLPCPKNFDNLLKYMYGDDYMIPSKTKPYYTKAYIIEE